jgi:hypothetical protein
MEKLGILGGEEKPEAGLTEYSHDSPYINIKI